MDARLIFDPPAPGPWNMAVDEALLHDAAQNGAATLRFYRWNEPTLSLGYFQNYADRNQHAGSRDCPVVRRQTGGGAILHDREITYSITLPSSHPFAGKNQELYRGAHQALIDTLRSQADSTSTSATYDIYNGADVASPIPPEPFLCFQRQAPGDVFLSTPSNGQAWKILGSAQRRSQRALLQHGSLLLERSPAAAELPGVRDLVQLAIPTEQLINAAAAQLASVLGLRFLETTLSPALQSKAAEIANNKYGSPLWTNRR